MTSQIRLNNLQVAPVSLGVRNWNSTNLLKVDLNKQKTYYEEREGAQNPREESYSPIGYKGPKLSTGARRRDVYISYVLYLINIMISTDTSI